MLVPALPEDKTAYVKTLASLTCFDVPLLSDEDRVRTQLYAQERVRDETKRDFASLDQWLLDLQTVVRFERLAAHNLPRATQLLNKTNQMNLRTRRLTEPEFWDWAQRDGHDVWAVTVRDHYGDAGLTGIITGASVLRAHYEQTAKNKPCLTFWEGSLHQLFRRLGFASTQASARARMRGVTQLGARARVVGAPFISNRDDIVIGDDFALWSSPQQSHLVAYANARIVIGNNVRICSGAAIAAATAIEIGHDVQLGRNVMIMDTDFHAAGAMHSSGNPSLVLIDAGARIGDNVVILKGTHIGAGARIGPASVVSGTFLPHTFASGVPARAIGTRRMGGPVADRVRAIATQFLSKNGDHAATDETNGLLEWDSLAALRLLLALEVEFAITLGDRALEGQQSIERLVTLVEAAIDA